MLRHLSHSKRLRLGPTPFQHTVHFGILLRERKPGPGFVSISLLSIKLYVATVLEKTILLLTLLILFFNGRKLWYCGSSSSVIKRSSKLNILVIISYNKNTISIFIAMVGFYILSYKLTTELF